jgi:hypothetical protein
MLYFRGVILVSLDCWGVLIGIHWVTWQLVAGITIWYTRFNPTNSYPFISSSAYRKGVSLSYGIHNTDQKPLIRIQLEQFYDPVVINPFVVILNSAVNLPQHLEHS